jgi:hypothetical protein
MVTCDGKATCTLRLGHGSTAACTGNSGCNVTCPQGGCMVDCQGSTQCSVTCTASAACSLVCPGGHAMTKSCAPGMSCSC